MSELSAKEIIANTIQQVLSEHRGESKESIVAALNNAFPFGEDGKTSSTNDKLWAAAKTRCIEELDRLVRWRKAVVG